MYMLKSGVYPEEKAELSLKLSRELDYAKIPLPLDRSLYHSTTRSLQDLLHFISSSSHS